MVPFRERPEQVGPAFLELVDPRKSRHQLAAVVRYQVVQEGVGLQIPVQELLEYQNLYQLREEEDCKSSGNWKTGYKVSSGRRIVKNK